MFVDYLTVRAETQYCDVEAKHMFHAILSGSLRKKGKVPVQKIMVSRRSTDSRIQATGKDMSRESF